MNLSRLKYRVGQLKLALWGKPTQEQFQLAVQVLTPELLALFKQLQLSEQAHALQVCRQLQETGATHPDLLTAALLHDIGKSKHKLRVRDRILIVLGQAFFSDDLEAWGEGESQGWGKPFVVASKHGEWGAQMAEAHGASRLAVALIRRHDEKGVESTAGLENRLLVELQNYDDQN